MIRPIDTEYEVLEPGILYRVLLHRRTGEDAYDTARRMLTHEALAASHGQQNMAALVLASTPRKVQWYAKDLQLRPIDRRASA